MNEIGEQRSLLSFGISQTSPPECQLTFTPSQHNNNSSKPFQVTLNWDQEQKKFEKDEVSMFVCNLCMKTFYNQNALQNHKNMTHDIADGDEIVNWKASAKIEQDFDGLCGFQFIPLNPEDINNYNSLNTIISRSFTEDTSYLLVKVDAEDHENYYSDKKSDLESQHLAKKVIPDSETPSVDLRGPFTCTLPSTMCPDLQCRQIFFNCCEYSLHYRDEHTKRRKSSLRCQVCEKRLDKELTAAKTRLADEYHAANTLMLACRICGIQFSDKSQYDEHNRVTHAKMKPHQCSICYKRFAQLGGLQQHLRMHTGIRPFVCTFCPKAFTQKAGLDQHLRIHTKVKPFKCVVCGKCFSQSVHLRQHMRTHTNIQPFECSVCKKRFKQRSHLNFHLRSHLNEHMVVGRHYEENMRRSDLDFFNFEKFQTAEDGESLYFATGPTGQHSPSHASKVDVPNPYDSPPAPDNAGKLNISNAYDNLSATGLNASVSIHDPYYNPPVSFHVANINASNHYNNPSALAPAANINIANPYNNVSNPVSSSNINIPNSYDNTLPPLCSANVDISTLYDNSPATSALASKMNISNPYDNPPGDSCTSNLDMPDLFDKPSAHAHDDTVDIPDHYDKPSEPVYDENVSNHYDSQNQNMLPILEASAPPV